jgi:hypothetical protein
MLCRRSREGRSSFDSSGQPKISGEAKSERYDLTNGLLSQTISAAGESRQTTVE